MATTMQNLAVPVSHTTERSQSPSGYYSRSVMRSTSPKSNDSKAPKSKESKTRKLRTAIAKSMKKVFGIKPKTAMVMPYETKQGKPSLSRSSSVHSVVSMQMNINRHSAPEICLTGPSVRGRNTMLSLHAYDGESSSPPEIEKTGKSIRFSHPAVQSVTVRPATALSTLTVETSNETDVAERGRSGSASSIQTASSNGTIPGPDSQLPTLRPKNIWRASTSPDGEQASFEEFKTRLDGHKLTGNTSKTDLRAPSLQFIARTSTIKLDGPFVEKKAPSHESAQIAKHRSEALNLLNTPAPKPAQKTSGKMVVAVIPESDMPASARRVPTGQFPANLLPKQYPSGLTPGAVPELVTPKAPAPKQRPHTIAAPSPYKAFKPYVAYSPHASMVSVIEPAPAQAPAPSKEQQGNSATRPKTPDIFAQDGVQHKQHYSRIESGVFGKRQTPPTRPANPEPPATPFSFESVNKAGRSFLDSPSPSPSPPASTKSDGAKAQAKSIPRKPVSTPNLRVRHSKALPPLPTARPELLRPESQVVEPQRMNSNRYPFFQNPAGTYSTESVYKRRSVDPVEAKYKKDEAVKGAKKAKIDAKSAKKAEKVAKQEEKAAIKSKKQQEIAAMDRAVGKLLP